MEPLRIFVSAGDVSGDLHGANLVRALFRLAPGAEIVGLGGPRMAAAGMRVIEDTVEFGVIGIAPIFGQVGRYLDILSRADRFLANWRPDVAVTIDCPGFHFLVGSRLRIRRVPTLWYIPPQLWAWAPWRVKKLRRRFTAVACVLPHEEAFFRDAGVPVTFVGHPVIDHLRAYWCQEVLMRSLRDRPKQRLVALLPGSRRQEIGPILARQLAVARAVAVRHPECAFVLALADEAHRARARPALAAADVPVRTVVGHTHEVQNAADLALVASGTATLELTYYRTPMVVFYNVPWAQWNLMGRYLVRTPYLSLPNVLAGREIVPEFVRDRPPGSDEIGAVLRLLEDREARAGMKEALDRIARDIERPGASENAARAALELVGAEVPPPPTWRWGFNQ